MKDMIKVNKIDHPKKIFMKVPCRESTENTQKSAFLSLGAQEGVQKSKLGLSHEFFFLHGLRGHPQVPTYQVSSELVKVYGSGSTLKLKFSVIFAIFGQFLKVLCLQSTIWARRAHMAYYRVKGRPLAYSYQGSKDSSVSTLALAPSRRPQRS